MKRDNASILLVDDDPALLQSLKEILNAEGYEVTTAADGEQGLLLLKEQVFDLVLSDLALPGQPAWLESRLVAPGRRLVVADTPWGRLGMSICFDLRFPELYRRLRLMGADLIAAPSAFTQKTGQVHWELLLRARAVENQCYVLAGAQWGDHGGGRASFGSAMIVDPWGQVLARCADGVGLVLAEVDPARVLEVRRTLDTAQLARLLPAAWRKGVRHD